MKYVGYAGVSECISYIENNTRMSSVIMYEIKYFVSFPEYIRINHIKKELKM